MLTSSTSYGRMLLVSTSRLKRGVEGVRPYHHGNLKDALLNAAAALITEVGPQYFTLREVARRAGVSHNAPYRHFRDKDELLAAVAEQGFLRLTNAMNKAASRGETALDRWTLSGHGYIAFALRWPQHFYVMFDAVFQKPKYPEYAAAGESAFSTLLHFITDAQAEGGLAAGDPLPLAFTSWSVVHGLAKLAINNRIPMKRDQVLKFFDDFVADMLRRGLAGRSKTAGS
jgi:AcrR family transcriptional regulator